MTLLYRQIVQQIKDKHLPDVSSRLLVGTSGGVDSMVLLSLLHRAGYTVAAVHCNFNLRPVDCDLDQELVEGYCQKLGIECFCTSFDTVATAKSRRISIEMAARDLRYTWFRELKAGLNFDYIATGHHLNDNIETLFLNIARGTGMRGLTAMHPIEGDIVRPLLFATKSQLLEYAYGNKIPYRNDYTNEDNSIIRNRLRNVVIPEFEGLNPSFAATMRNNIGIWSDWFDFSNCELQKIKNRLISKVSEGLFLTIKSGTNPKVVRLILFDLLFEQGYGGKQSADYLKIIESQTGACITTNRHKIVRERDGILILDKSVTDDFNPVNIEILPFTITLKSGLNIELTEVKTQAVLSDDKTTECIDFDKVTFPLTLRLWSKGDTFYPLGMRGSKKISDYLTDIKKRSVDKRQQLVLTDQKGIMWVVGARLDRRYALSETSSRFMKLSCSPLLF